MNRFEFLGVLAIALLVAINVDGAIHELGHLTIATAFGAHVVKFQPWSFLGNPQTIVSRLPDVPHAIVAVSGVLASSLVVVLLLMTIPWQTLKPRVAVAGAVYISRR